MSNSNLEESKNADIHNHRMKNALFAVLCEIKERTCVNYRNLEMEVSCDWSPADHVTPVLTSHWLRTRPTRS